jgi:hypothetical protein
MSIPVELETLRDQIGRHGTSGFMVTAGEDGRPHVVSMVPRWTDDHPLTAMRVGGGRRTVANIARHRSVALLWPAYEPGGYSLIVDATASVDGTDVVLTATKAVLHRPAVADAKR